MLNSAMSVEARVTGTPCAAWTVELDSKNLESLGSRGSSVRAARAVRAADSVVRAARVLRATTRKV